MKKNYFKKLVLITALLTIKSVNAQNELAIYNFNGTGQETCANRVVSPSSTPTPNTNITFGDFASVNVSCVQTANQFNNDGWNSNSTIDMTEYVEFTMTADAGFEFIIDSLYFDVRSSQLGGNLTVKSSIDNFNGDISSFYFYDGTSWTPVSTIDIPDAYLTFKTSSTSSFNYISNITFRFYSTNVVAASTTIRLDNVIPYGRVRQNTNSLSPIEINKLSIYPNPGMESIQIQSTENGKITFIDINGKTIYQTEIVDSSLEINTSNFEKGTYFISLENNYGKTIYNWHKL